MTALYPHPTPLPSVAPLRVGGGLSAYIQLIIEAKKSDNSEKDDKQKINAYIEHLNYEQGLFVNFDTGQDIDELSYQCDWYPFEEKSD